MVHDYLDFAFTATSGRKFAFNKGNYRIRTVKASGPGWVHYNSPNADFQVLIPSGAHPVFVVVFKNQEWSNAGYLPPSIYIYQASARFEYWFDIDLIVAFELTWTPTPEASSTALLNELSGTATQALQLPQAWDDQPYTVSGHHGFDVIAGFTGYLSDHSGRAGNSRFVVAKGGIGEAIVPGISMDNLVQHEASHMYGALERWDFEVWLGQPSVMSKPWGLYNADHWGWADLILMEPREGQFDGI
ncbi:MAG: hypothetical protein ACFFE8_12750 [Candidatus Heimdallarchaeota archaeon]